MMDSGDMTMGSRSVRHLALMAAVLALAACSSRISEPWVTSDQELKGERSRTPEQAVELRERVADQMDR